MGRPTSSLVREAVERMRAGAVRAVPGYDGVAGAVRLFEPAELQGRTGVLFPAAIVSQAPRRRRRVATPAPAPLVAPVPGLNAPPALRTGLEGDQLALVVAEAPILWVAGTPGSGKTHALVERAAYLVRERLVPPSAVLLLHPTEHAARCARRRLEALLGIAGTAVRCETFHQLALTLLREQAAHSGLPADVHIIDEASRAKILCTALDIKERVARRLLAEISRCKRHRQPPPVGSTLDQAFATYARYLRARGQIDFDDLLLRAAQLLEDAEGVRACYRRRWQHVLVDDCQRMDDGQYRLLRVLVGAAGGPHLCAVGEADPAPVWAQMERDWPQGERLPWNRRHHADVVQLHAAMSEIAEAEFVARTIASACSTGRQPQDFAVLYRTVRQASLLHTALGRVGLVAQSRAAGRLVDDPVLQTLVGLMGKAAKKTSHGGPLTERLAHAAARLYARTPERYRAAVRRAADTLMPLVQQCGHDMQRLRRTLPLLHAVDTLSPEQPAVLLLPLEAARGLSFAVVFIVGLEEGFYPYGVGPWSKQVLAQERALVRFAMTRARERLVLSYARQRVWRGRLRPRVLSPLVGDVPAAPLGMPPAPRAPRPPAATPNQMALF